MHTTSDSVWLIFLAPYALIIALIAALTIRSLKRLVKNFRLPRRYAMERSALLCFGLALILGLHFWLAGSPNTGYAATANNGYIEAQIGAGLIIIGIILSYFAYPPRRKTAAEKTAAQKARSTWPRWRRHKLIECAAILLVVICGVAVYQKISTNNNHRDFMRARTTIDNIYYAATKQIGPADSAQISSSCSRSHEEFSQGVLTCSLSTKFIYGVDDEIHANKLLENMQNLISSNHSIKSTMPLSNGIQDALVVNSYYHTTHDYYKSNGLGCEASYIYNTPRLIDLHLINPIKKPLEIVLGCSGPAKQQYYRLAT